MKLRDVFRQATGREPADLQEWQRCADVADFLLRLEAARQWGFVMIDLKPAIERCEGILRRAREKGITPNWEDGLRIIFPEIPR